MEVNKIIELAFKASENSYSPYSNFKVGACIEVKDGSYFFGTNIENAAFGSTMCAERNAVYSCYCNGYTKDDIVQLAIVGYGDDIISPCGACRQVLVELLPLDCPIVLANEHEHQVYTIKDLLPLAFSEESL